MLRWCIKVLLCQFQIFSLIIILRAKSSHQNWQKKPKIKKSLLHLITSKWGLCLKKNKTKWTSTNKCRMMGFSWLKRLFNMIKMLFKRKMKVIIRNNKITSISNNKMMKKRKKMTMTSSILAGPKWTFSRKEQEKF